MMRKNSFFKGFQLQVRMTETQTTVGQVKFSGNPMTTRIANREGMHQIVITRTTKWRPTISPSLWDLSRMGLLNFIPSLLSHSLRTTIATYPKSPNVSPTPGIHTIGFQFVHRSPCLRTHNDWLIRRNLNRKNENDTHNFKRTYSSLNRSCILHHLINPPSYLPHHHEAPHIHGL